MNHHRIYKFIWILPLVQALILLLPGWMWSWMEDGRLEDLLPPENASEDIREASTSSTVKFLSIYKGTATSYFTSYFFCHLLHLLSLFICICMSNMLFRGEFLWYGLSVFQQTEDSVLPVVDSIFPLTTKCTIPSAGPSGSRETNDAICQMTLNDIYRVAFFAQSC